MRILNWQEIQENLVDCDLIKNQTEAFTAYSSGKVVMPPVGHLEIEDFSGECHIKYGYIRDSKYFVIKIATSFFDNPKKDLPCGNGMLLVFNRETGMTEALLNDEGHLTDLRTAIAGAIAAKYLAPKIKRIGIMGTGVQAKLQLEQLEKVTECRDVLVWGRNPLRVKEYLKYFSQSAFQVEAASDVAELASLCNLIVTTTASHEPLLFADQILPGTHITAVGADGGGKQELDPLLFKKAELRIVDSVNQCSLFGDTSSALERGCVEKTQLTELGAVIQNPKLGRQREDQISIADLTGMAVQDIQIAKAALGQS